jgi:hypothetical protein
LQTCGAQTIRTLNQWVTIPADAHTAAVVIYGMTTWLMDATAAVLFSEEIDMNYDWHDNDDCNGGVFVGVSLGAIIVATTIWAIYLMCN